MINVAILGYGTVGSGVFEVLNENKESISRRAGQELHVKYVLDLRDFPGQPVEKVLVHDYEQIVSDPEVDIVVEVMGGVEPAYTFVKKALLAGKNVCTSNKALVAKHGRELMDIAKEKSINFLFEASCGGGIFCLLPVYIWQLPMHSLLRNISPQDLLLSVPLKLLCSYKYLFVSALNG